MKNDITEHVRSSKTLVFAYVFYKRAFAMHSQIRQQNQFKKTLTNVHKSYKIIEISSQNCSSNKVFENMSQILKIKKKENHISERSYHQVGATNLRGAAPKPLDTPRTSKIKKNRVLLAPQEPY